MSVCKITLIPVKGEEFGPAIVGAVADSRGYKDISFINHSLDGNVYVASNCNDLQHLHALLTVALTACEEEMDRND